MSKPSKVVVAAVIAAMAPQLALAQNNSFADSTVQSSAASSGQALQASQASSIGTLIVLGAGLLAGVGGGITTTMYKRDERAKRLATPPAPPPPPANPVEPMPDPGVPPPPPPPLSKRGPDGEPTLDAMVEARWWLLANEVQLKQDLALGAGPSIDDLAGLAGISPMRRVHFGRVLQKNRARLLMPREMTPQQAAQVMSQVGELVLADPILRVDGEAVLATR
ncbi:MAG: DUF3015 family protein [Archangium sp.]|nr:DUF3015 family protein [Archangium sp.]